MFNKVISLLHLHKLKEICKAGQEKYWTYNKLKNKPERIERLTWSELNWKQSQYVHQVLKYIHFSENLIRNFLSQEPLSFWQQQYLVTNN